MNHPSRDTLLQMISTALFPEGEVAQLDPTVLDQLLEPYQPLFSASAEHATDERSLISLLDQYLQRITSKDEGWELLRTHLALRLLHQNERWRQLCDEEQADFYTCLADRLNLGKVAKSRFRYLHDTLIEQFLEVSPDPEALPSRSYLLELIPLWREFDGQPQRQQASAAIARAAQTLEHDVTHRLVMDGQEVTPEAIQYAARARLARIAQEAPTLRALRHALRALDDQPRSVGDLPTPRVISRQVLDPLTLREITRYDVRFEDLDESAFEHLQECLQGIVDFGG